MNDCIKFTISFLSSKDNLNFLHEYQIVAFIFGAINSIARQSVQVSENKSAEEAEGAFIAITVLYLVASIAVLAVKILALYLIFLRPTEKRQSVRFVVGVHLIPSTLMFVSSLFYYLGDNLGNFFSLYGEDLGCSQIPKNGTYTSCAERAKVSSLWLLILGIVGFHFVPMLKSKIIESAPQTVLSQTVEITGAISQAETVNENSQANQKASANSQTVEIARAFYDVLTAVLGSVVTFDGYYTAFIKLSDDDPRITRCEGLSISYWIVFVFMLIFFAFFLITQFYQFLRRHNNTNGNDRHKSKWCLLIIAMFNVMLIVTGLFIIADNARPLNCSVAECIGNNSFKCTKLSQVRVSLLCVSLLLYGVPVTVIISIVFYILKEYKAKIRMTENPLQSLVKN